MKIHINALPDIEELLDKIEEVNSLNENSDYSTQEKYFADLVKLICSDYQDFILRKLLAVPPQISLDILIDYHDYFGTLIALGEALKGLARSKGFKNAKIADGKGGTKDAPMTARDTFSRMQSKGIDSLLELLENKYKNIYQRIDSLKSRNNKF